MNKKIVSFRVFKYKGEIYHVAEANDLPVLPGVRFKGQGVTILLLDKNLPFRKKQLELHRLLTGRGLRDIRTNKKVKIA